jgi:hypothetical protein
VYSGSCRTAQPTCLYLFPLNSLVRPLATSSRFVTVILTAAFAVCPTSGFLPNSSAVTSSDVLSKDLDAEGFILSNLDSVLNCGDVKQKSLPLRSQDPVGRAVQVGAGQRTAEVPNARWR